MSRPARSHAFFASLCVLLVAAATSTRDAAAAPTLANPASKHCADQGGTLTIERNGGGAEFGVCTFADNLQCEEWALLRGDCRAGGIKVTGYVTPAARYCALAGGAYADTSGGNTPEQCTCTLKGGKTCQASAYFSGACSRGGAKPARAAATTSSIKARFLCSAGKFIDAAFVSGAANSVDLELSDGRAMTLPQTMSGSGARYANAGESIVFWNKGNTAFIEESGTTTFNGCATRR